MNMYIGADLGTSALKLLLVGSDGKILNTVSKSYAVYYPNPGWSEQNPEDWWDAFVSGVLELTNSFDLKKICGLSVAGQMHGLVILDENDSVIRPAILWNDGRTQKETDFLNEKIGKDTLSELTANIAFAGFTAPKLLWLMENEPENFKKISKIMLPKDYILYRLTGVHSTDYSDASGMLLLDVENKRWSEKMLEICHVSENQLPSLYESYEVTGTIKKDIATRLGFGDNVLCAAGAGDNAGAALGTNVAGNGKCNISLGTSGTIFITSDKFGVDDNNGLHSFCHSDGAYHLMGCILSAASCNKWFCDEILKTDNYATDQTNIDTDSILQNDLFFLPYLMGERSPINDTDATGVFLGLRPTTKRSDMILAILEGVAFAIRDNLEIAKKLGIKIEKSTICGGGAKSELWRKIIANVLNIRIDVPKTEEGPGMGAAYLAMVACGEFKTVLECSEKFFKIKDTVLPENKLSGHYEAKYRKFTKIYPEIKNLYKEIR